MFKAAMKGGAAESGNVGKLCNRDGLAKTLSKILNGIDDGHRMVASEYHLGNVPAVRAIQKPVINLSLDHRRERWQSPWRVEQAHKP
ncbi:hypothetical protein D3C80_1400740 [compost metagenome]